MTPSINDKMQNKTLPLCSVVMLCGVLWLIYCYAECRYAECRYNERHGANTNLSL
jgi:hypothetical protein